MIRKFPSFFIPYLIATAGIIGDYVTSIIGLSMGYVETHINYSPVNAVLIFYPCLFLIYATFRKESARLRFPAMVLVAALSLWGMIHNIAVLFIT